ncbi:AMIN domain-containing protein [Methylobacterium oryzae]|uniref:AMIN domain-containing protein n=1 Tax=Methylobacterium oryzae TaxID=334852 RepID=UPI003AF5CDFF
MPNCARLIRSAWLRLAVALLPALTGMPAAAQNGEKPAVAIGADVASQAGTTRLTLTMSRAVEARGFVMERPDRAVIDLPEVNFQLDSGTGSRRDGLVQSFRYGLFAPGRSRIVIDLTAPATVGKIETATRPRDGAVLLTIPLQRADREAFRKAAATADPAPAQAIPPPPRPAPRRRSPPTSGR